MTLQEWKARDLSIGIFTTDLRLEIGSWDDWLARATGISPERARGTNLAALFPDLEPHGIVERFRRVLTDRVVEVLAPKLHHYQFSCASAIQSPQFENMQQRVTIAPLRENDEAVGTIVSVEDVTSRMELEIARANGQIDETSRGLLFLQKETTPEEIREVSEPVVASLSSENWRMRGAAVDAIARHASPDLIESLPLAIRDGHDHLGLLNSALQVFTLSGVDAVSTLGSVSA